MNRLPEQSASFDADAAFDARARATYLRAADAVPSQLRFKLRPLPAAKVQPRRQAWPWAAALAGSAAVLVVALTLGPDRGPMPATAPTAIVASGSTADPQDDGMLSAPPDFFAWLGSDEVRSLSME